MSLTHVAVQPILLGCCITGNMEHQGFLWIQQQCQFERRTQSLTVGGCLRISLNTLCCAVFDLKFFGYTLQFRFCCSKKEAYHTSRGKYPFALLILRVPYFPYGFEHLWGTSFSGQHSKSQSTGSGCYCMVSICRCVVASKRKLSVSCCGIAQNECCCKTSNDYPDLAHHCPHSTNNLENISSIDDLTLTMRAQNSSSAWSDSSRCNSARIRHRQRGKRSTTVTSDMRHCSCSTEVDACRSHCSHAPGTQLLCLRGLFAVDLHCIKSLLV